MSGRSPSTAVRRLTTEYKELMRNAPEGIIAGPLNEDNLFKWEATIQGPVGTPFEGGIFNAILDFPKDYPLSPPTMQFTSDIFHPNIYANGLVCISILHAPGDDPNQYESSSERWSPVQSVEKILLSVISMLAEPNDESGANLDAAKMWRNDREQYEEKVMVEKTGRESIGRINVTETALIYLGAEKSSSDFYKSEPQTANVHIPRHFNEVKLGIESHGCKQSKTDDSKQTASLATHKKQYAINLGALRRFSIDLNFPELSACQDSLELSKLIRKFHVIQMVLGAYEFPAEFNAKYKVDGVLGDGTFGFVVKGRCVADDKEVAIKFVSMKIAGKGEGDNFITHDKPFLNHSSWAINDTGKDGTTRVPLEVEILSKCSHRNIIKFLDYFQDGNYHYLVTERHGKQWRSAQTLPSTQNHPDPNSFMTLVPRDPNLINFHHFTQRLISLADNKFDIVFPTDLFECIESCRSLPTPAIKKITCQLIDALLYLEEVIGCSHGDIKDENILIDAEYNIKLVDFGSATYTKSLTEHSTSTKFIGTLQFAPPEVLSGQGYFGVKSDVWSIGSLLFLMLTGSNFVNGIVRIQRTGIYTYKTASLKEVEKIAGDVELLELMSGLLNVDPVCRMSLQEAQLHSWLIL